MIEVHIPASDLWNKRKREFIAIPETTLRLEHSLVSISKWEANWGVPFLETENKTAEQVIDYIRCMNMTQGVNPNVYYAIPPGEQQRIEEYINNPMTATTFSGKNSGGKNSEGVTSELIYYWMFSNQIPKECEKWHLNRLLTLIKIFGTKNQKQKKKPQRQVQDEYRAINAKRRAEQAAKSGGKR